MAGVKRPMSQMRKIEAKEAVFRARKHILKYLVQAYLKQERYLHTADAFAEEAQLTGDYEVCDNIDLDIILQDYCSYYLMRFNKQPQFCRKVESVTQPQRRPQTRKGDRKAHELECEREPALPTFTVTQLLKGVEEADGSISSALPTVETKPLSGLLSKASPEKREIIEMLYRETVVTISGVSWEDIVGLDDAKSLLMEAVVYPVRYPALFTGALSPWRGVLLHGPPGGGKTALARAAAAAARCTLLNVTASSIVNKWRGDSEKIVRALFEMASYYAPCVVFVDEAEALAGGASCGGQEPARRLRAQLLAETDGLLARAGLVLLLANTNTPWDIDPAMLRRLEKRIHIPLPDFKARAKLFEKFLDSKNVELYPKVNFEELAAKTDGYSGNDIRLACKEALMTTVRRMLPNMVGKSNYSNHKDKLNLSDILTAIEKTKPVSKNLAKKYVEWQNEMGCS